MQGYPQINQGGLIIRGKHLIRGWSAAQKVIALSSGEAEYYGMVRWGI